jgi:hypothetical protein
MHSIAQALPGALATLLREAPLSPGKVDFAWKTAVGPALGRATFVRLEGDLLLVDVASPQWAREVNRSARIVVARMQALLGDGQVRRLVVRTRD